ncbi:DHA2 family efflux MFS transporter permease subunit [Brevibacillus dissolubilis]|uniref:DHA2 family efflux MFS transporter permease subunit n=1 Tax=Brevibacillus dissolubilis TaxID=1844116 RepID=UPI001115F9D8|nr:DHA2 family efflux MFS transporter permease subunit [Brevibacillus dissolubilis]
MSDSVNQQQNDSSYKWFALMAIISGTFVAVLNNSLLNVALPQLVNVFGSTTDTMQWILTGYMLASAVVIPMSPALCDMFGYKKVFLVSLAAFTVGSALCGIAWSDSSLIFFRIVSGLGGGFIMPVGMAMLYASIPRNEIGLAMGLWGIAAMVAPAIGPTLSGYILEHFSWRLLFFMSVPVGIASIFLSASMLRETPTKKVKFDYAGAILSIIAFGTLLLALSKGQSEGWTSLFIVSLLFVAVSSMAMLIYVETGKEQPLMDLSLFKNLQFSMGTLASGLVMVGMYGGVFLTPLYLQNIQGLTPMETGLLLMPQSIAMALMMPISGKLMDKFGVVPLGLVGLTVMGVSTYELSTLTADTPNEWLNHILIIRGLAIGICMMPLTSAGTNAVEPQKVGSASSLGNVFRQVMSSLGIALLTMMMSTRSTFHGVRMSENLSLDSLQGTQFVTMLSGLYGQSGVDAATSKAGAMMILGGLIQKESFVRGIADTFLISAVPIFLCIPLLYFLRKKKAVKTPPKEVEVADTAEAAS